MIELIDKVSFLPDISLIEKIVASYTKKDIELIITTNQEIQEINRIYRDIDKPTDVLSFPLNGSKKDPLGSIVISIDFVKDVAREFDHSEEEEFILLFIHGMLHLLGFDHELDNGEMREEEEKIIKKWNLPKSLIVRNGG